MDKRGKSRLLLEVGKDILILLLACSAVYLTMQIRWGGTLSSGTAGQEADGGIEEQISEPVEMVQPVRMAANSTSGGSIIRYGVQYDRQGVEELFRRGANLLTEALSNPGQAQAVSQREWREALTIAPSLYFDLMGQVPLSVLSGWLGGDAGQEQAAVRRLALAVTDGQTVLYYQDEESGRYYAAPAEVVSVSSLESVVSGLSDNGVAFAFELEEQYPGLDPCTMLMPDPPRPTVYRASNPVATDGGLEAMLEALDFPTANNYIYTVAGGQAVLSGNDTLRISSRGEVTYEAAQGEASRYPVSGAGCYDAVEACRLLAAAALRGQNSAARLVLSQVEAVSGGWQIDFVYCLDGAEVQVFEAGYAARFLVENGEITQFRLQLRSYESTGETSLVLPEAQAMAAMGALELEGKELLLIYSDNGGETAAAGWAARA